MDDEQASVNAEMRYLTLELMKIAAGKDKRFRDVADEFIENVYALEKLVRERSARKSKKEARLALGERPGSRERPLFEG